ncbi:MAG: dienelactone hydrolase family protein [Acidobacteriia bacterium]|nr:dienelactone hydrolase family protein [Terriglobia bacterium]
MDDGGASSASPHVLEAGQPRGKARLAGILLHGRDRTREEKVVLADHVDVDGVRWLAPAAEAGSWYPGRFFDPIEANEPHLSQAIEQLDRVVEEAREGGRLDPRHIFLVGFSQGACLALEYGLRRPGRVGALVVFTGGIFGGPEHPRSFPASLLNGLRVLLTGSDADDWISEASTRQTAGQLTTLGAEVTLRIYQGRPHVVSPEELDEARRFIEGLKS